MVTGIVATVSANLAHGFGHGLVSAWLALALLGSFELLMMPICSGRGAWTDDIEPRERNQAAPLAPKRHLYCLLRQLWSRLSAPGTRQAAASAIARDLNIDRRKVKRILDQAA